MAELIVGHRLSLDGFGSWQNYNLGSGDFLPFGFSGAVFNRHGDNISATLNFPNNGLSVSWMMGLVDAKAVASISEICNGQTVFTYVGQVTSGTVAEVEVSLQLNTVLDAVANEVPWRYLTEELVGPIPMSSGVRMS